MSHFDDALAGIVAATNQQDLNAVYAQHITRLILNGASRDQLKTVAEAWRMRSFRLFYEATGWEQP